MKGRKDDADDEDEVMTVWEFIRPRTPVQWVLAVLFIAIAMALAFGIGLWAGGFIW